MFAPDEPDEPYARGPYATRAEIEACLNALTARENRDLIRRARYIAQKSGNKQGDGDDLLSTVVLKILREPPERRWYPQRIDFFPFLVSAIRSIGSSWRKTTEHEKRFLSTGSEEAPHSEQAVTNEIRAYLTGQSHEYPHALGILNLLIKGHTGTEIQEILGIAPHVYKATLRWMRATLSEKGYRP